jgi:hypothetical protein
MRVYRSIHMAHWHRIESLWQQIAITVKMFA